MKEPNEIQLLERVGRVDAPVDLLSKVEARIAALQEDKLPSQWVWLAAASLALMIALNTLALSNSLKSVGASSSDAAAITTGLGIQISNQFYK